MLLCCYRSRENKGVAAEMDKEKQLEIVEGRDYKVVKGNDIIQKARYELGLAEIKAFSFIISKIRPNDQPFQEYTFTINEYCKILGIETNNGKNIRTVKKSLKSLVDKSFFLTLDDGTETTVSWINKVWINKGTGRIKVRLDDDLQKYVTNLYNNFTQYELFCTLPMRSTYSIRIYELLKSYAYQGKQHTFDVDLLKRQLCCEHYKRFQDFRRKVLEVATKEINEYTDLEVSWEPIKEGKRFTCITFTIAQRDTWGRLETMFNANNVLQKEQVRLEDYLEELEKGKKQ